MTRREHDIDPRDTDAKLSLQRREQLSALVDGELAPDQARFLLRRLGHDTELAGRLERWQLAGDILRGQPVRAVPGDATLPACVMAAVAGEPVPRVAPASLRWQRVVGLAAAASVAAVALVLVRPASDGAVPGAVESGVVAVPAEVAPAPVVPDPVPASPEPVLREATVPQFADAAPPEPERRAPADVPAPTRVAVASPPEATREPPATPALPARDDATMTVLAAGDLRPFATPVEPQARPWPRAVLPGLGDGELAVGYDDEAAPSFYPFEPRLPEETER